MKSTMVHQFSQVPKAEIPRSSFDRSHGFKTTFDAGWLVPFFVDEALPGDTFSLSANMFGRLSTPLHPFMDNMFIDTFYFAVPLRLVWDNFQKFMGEQRNPTDSTSFLCPTMTSPAGGYLEMTLQDYMGLPTKVPGLVHNTFHLRAYNLIWNEWFRDQNLQNSVVVDVDDGPDTPTDYVLLKRGKRHDYFTSALPWPQKGPAVSIPIGTLAPVAATGPLVMKDSFATKLAEMKYESSGATPPGPVVGLKNLSGAWVDEDSLVYSSGLITDLSSATATTINALRQSFQIQKIYERDARGGTRYTELIQSHFGVTSPDARLQRPEFLGGGSTPLNVNPIAQTSNIASSPTPLGNLAAMGTVHGRSSGFSKSFTEHSVIIGLVMARADLNYQNGLNRMFSRSTRWDFFWPALSHIGEQTILNKEIYAVGTSGGGTAQDAAAFGYQERWAEYRYKPSTVTGQFRSNSTLPLDTWHLAQTFGALPVLNASFIQEAPPVDRVIAVPTEPHFLLDVYFSFRCARPMPVYSVPGLIDHF